MKTNQIMQLQFDDYQLEICHKDMMGSLNSLWSIGNAMRVKRGLNELDMKHYMTSPETLELVKACEVEFGYRDINNVDFIDISNCADSAELNSRSKKKKGVVKTIKSPLIKVKEGRYGGTWAHLYILLDAAGKLDASFKVQIYKRVIDGGLLKWRDDSGDSYKALNIAIDMMTYENSGNHPDVSVYIYVADCIRENIKPTGGKWNTATHEELSLRTRIENTLISFCKAGVVDDYNHLCKLISKIK